MGVRLWRSRCALARALIQHRWISRHFAPGARQVARPALPFTSAQPARTIAAQTSAKPRCTRPIPLPGPTQMTLNHTNHNTENARNARASDSYLQSLGERVEQGLRAGLVGPERLEFF